MKPILMVTDPPCGVDYDPEWRHRHGVSSSKRTGKVGNDDRADWRAAWALFPGSIAYVWHGALHATTVAESLEAEGFSIRAQIIWAKDRLVIGRGDHHWQHEPCRYAVRKTGHRVGDRKQTTLGTIANRNEDAETVHGTQKPVECMRRPMLNNSSPGQTVYEPFTGSGTTLIAAQSCGRAGRPSLAKPPSVRETAGRSIASREVLTLPIALPETTEMRGREPKPTRLKVLTGNPGKRPLNHHEPRPEPAIPDCPPELGEAAQREWQHLVGELSKLNLLTHLDRAALAAYCNAYAMRVEAIEAIQKYRSMVKSPSRYPVQSPYVAIANRQAEIMLRISAEFGFRPASRGRIAAPECCELPLFGWKGEAKQFE